MKIIANQLSTKVRDVRAVEGDSVELYCPINNKSTEFSAARFNKLLDGQSTINVYEHVKDNEKTLKDAAGDGYENRVERVGDGVVKLKNVTESDSGTYRCSRYEESDLGSSTKSAEVNLRVIGKY